MDIASNVIQLKDNAARHCSSGQPATLRTFLREAKAALTLYNRSLTPSSTTTTLRGPQAPRDAVNSSATPPNAPSRILASNMGSNHDHTPANITKIPHSALSYQTPRITEDHARPAERGDCAKTQLIRPDGKAIVAYCARQVIRYSMHCLKT